MSNLMTLNFDLTSVEFECAFKAQAAQTSHLSSNLRTLYRLIDEAEHAPPSLYNFRRLNDLYLRVISIASDDVMVDLYKLAKMYRQKIDFTHGMPDIMYESMLIAFECYKMYICVQLDLKRDIFESGTSTNARSLAYIAECYYNGIPTYMEKNKRIGLYYQYLAHVMQEGNTRIYDRLLEMYTETHDSGIRVFTHEERETIDPTIVHANRLRDVEFIYKRVFVKTVLGTT